VARGYATNQNLVARLQAANAQQPPWSTRYPTLARLLEGRRDVPTGDIIEGNVAVDSPQLFHTSGKQAEFTLSTVTNNIALTAAEAGFVSSARLDFGCGRTPPCSNCFPLQTDSLRADRLAARRVPHGAADIVRTFAPAAAGLGVRFEHGRAAHKPP
jgi:hypothetical protein